MVFQEEIRDFAGDLSTANLVDVSEYGGANPDRDQLAIYNYFFKRDADMNDVAITLDNSTPLTVALWNFALPSQDGLFVYITFGFPIWSAGSYVLNNCVYYSGSYYKALTTTNAVPGSDPAKWALITDILGEVLDLANSNVYVTQGYAFSTARGSAGPIGDAVQALGPKIVAGKCKNWNEAAQAGLGRGLINSAWANFRRQDYVEAQKIADYINNQYAVPA